MPKEKYESPNPRRTHTLMSPEDVAAGKKSSWYELEITGSVRNVCPELWKLRNLTSLYLNDNSLVRLPPDICKLTKLTYLDLSSNKLRSLPAELGELICLRELLLNHNHLRSLPFEIGKLFQLQVLGLKGNPLNPEIIALYNETNGTAKLLSFLLDHITTPPPSTYKPEGKSFPLGHILLVAGGSRTTFSRNLFTDFISCGDPEFLSLSAQLNIIK